MPKVKSKRPATKPTKTAARAPAKRASAAASKASSAKQAKATKPKGRPAPSRRVEPRVVAAIGLALHDEDVAAARASQLTQELSPWTALGRVRAVRSR